MIKNPELCDTKICQGEVQVRFEGNKKFIYCPKCMSRHIKEIQITPVLDVSEFEDMFKD